MPAVAVMPVGSPPRMRGKGTPVLRGFGRTGITPACAGKSPAATPAAAGHQDHPRVCGEKQVARADEMGVEGSPPRMRGKAACVDARPLYGRITPAYAGKSCPCRITSLACRDHPRVCGEKSAGGHSVCGILGSPPRMRGKGILGAVNKSNIGITPAYAGKSCRCSRAF